MKRSHAVLLLFLLIGGIVVVILRLPGTTQQPGTPTSQQAPDETRIVEALALPPYSESPYLNIKPDAKYISSAACTVCHPNNHKSYLLTAHSKALCDVNSNDEPPEAAFEHKASGRSYRVYRKDGQLWQQELLRTAEGKEIARTELPLRYRVGSGHFARTYFVEVDGFLHEAPVTWYASKAKWDMSPGYDTPNHYGFQRAIRGDCVRCHAGQFEQTGDHKIRFLEQAIGCENCHGPGSVHQEFHLSKKLMPGERDYTIVHPGKLSRPLLESVCASCHLSTTTSVNVRGRQATSYRPGLPLSDFQIHYNTWTRDTMTVVGHVEQLRQSKCYQKSESLSCITCHDPHAKSKPADPVAFHKQKCLDCHASQPCSLPSEERLKQNPADNCVACHMPRGNTDVQHVAFTHHRIGRHGKQPEPMPVSDATTELVAFDDNPRLTEPDRQRNLGLAYKELARGATSERAAGEYRERARTNLLAAYRAGVRDAQTLTALSEFSIFTGEIHSAAELARAALAASDIDPRSHSECLDVLATCARQNRDLPAAIEHMQQLVKIRRLADDWTMLGACYLRENKLEQARSALQQGIAIWPHRFATHSELAECYQRLGDMQRARDEREKADWFKRHIEKQSPFK